MANWLHRLTLEYRICSDPPLSEQSAWLRNPTLPAGVTDWADVIVDGDVVRAPTTDEAIAREAARLAEFKRRKIEAIDSRTAYLIETGSVVINGESMSTRATQQISLLGIKAAVDANLGSGAFPRELSATDGSTYLCPDQADFVRVSSLVLAFVEAKKSSGRALRTQVLAATSLAAVAAVVDDRS